MNFFLLIQNAVMAALAATGFGMIFNVPKKAIGFCAMCGAFGVSIRKMLVVLTDGSVSVALATLAAATIVAFAAEFLSRKMRMPPTTFSVPGVIPMIPGSLMFRSIVYAFGMVSGGTESFDAVLFGKGFELAANATVILASIALGVAAPNLIFYRRRSET